MRHGSILPGQEHFDLEYWRNDNLEECHFNDRLWGWTCREGEELRVREPGYFTDPVIYNLIRMGVHNWTGANHRGNQSMQAMRHSTIMGSRLHRLHREAVANVRDDLLSCGR